MRGPRVGVRNSLLAGHDADYGVPTVLADDIYIGTCGESSCEGPIVAGQGGIEQFLVLGILGGGVVWA